MPIFLYWRSVGNLPHVCKSWLNCLHVIRRGAVYSTSAYKGIPTTFQLRRGIAARASFFLFSNGREGCKANKNTIRMKKIIVLTTILAGLTMADVSDCKIWQSNVCYAAKQARNDGTYSATSQTVSVYTESGHPKGSFTVYLHHGQKYIKFQNSWVCIQGKSRFSFNGNWYIIK